MSRSPDPGTISATKICVHINDLFALSINSKSVERSTRLKSIIPMENSNVADHCEKIDLFPDTYIVVLGIGYWFG